MIELYVVPGGAPSLACQQTLKALNVDFALKSVNFNIGEFLTPEFEKLNPQKEVPVLNDNGFLLSESTAIMQYLAEEYAKDDLLYPKNTKTRAIVNHRLCFNVSTYYKHICNHVIAPIYFKVERSDFSLQMVHLAVKILNEYFQRAGTKYVAANHVTIADFALITSTMCLDIVNFDLSKYSHVQKWYETFKAEYPNLYAIAVEEMKEIHDYEHVQPPDLSKLQHPFLPVRK